MSKRVWLPLLIVVVVFLVTVMFCGVGLWVYVDAPSLVLVPIAPFLFMTLSYGWSATRAAFRAPLKAESTRRELELSALYFKTFGTAIWCFGALGSLTGVIALLVSLTDKAKVGPNAAIALITSLYAALFTVGLTLPFLSAARKRLAELG